MNGPVAGPALPLIFAQAALGTDQTTGAVAGVWQTLNFNTNLLSFLDSTIDRPTASRFRALIPGYYQYDYTATAWFAANQRGGLFRVFLNNLSEVAGSQAAVFANSGGLNKAGSCSKRGIILLTANDFLELQANPHNGSAITVSAQSTFSLRLVRF